MADEQLRIKEIFRSIQGESTWAGWPCTFVRTVGCELRCVYCDEAHAFSGGESMSVDQVVERVAELGLPLVELTGGEPLQQRALPELVRRLCDAGYRVLIETGGHRDVSIVDPRARVILDIKTPGSGMLERNDWRNLERLRPGDEIKLVLCGRADYEWARALVRERDLAARATVHFSPVHGALDPQDLVAWVLEDHLPVRVNLQLHKYIWGPDARGV
jgi:7-carboxy-7-deazaguanine synthase